MNYHFLRAICDLLNIKTTLTWSTDYCVQDDLRKSDRLLALCQQANATHYISGPSANNYLDIDLFNAQNMTVSYIDYSNYPTYPQLFNEFEHGVSIVDLILNVGADARKYLKSCLDAELLIKETA